MTRNEARVLAIKNVYQMISTNTLMADVVKQYDSDNEFIHLLSFGVFDNLEELNLVIIDNLKEGWSLKRLNIIDHAILLVACFELLHSDLDRKVIINEAVNISKDYCDDDRYKFINGVLDNIGQ